MKTLIKYAVAASASAALLASCTNTNQPEPEQKGDFASELKLSEYRPVSVFKTPQSNIQHAKFPVIDMHSHAYVDNVEDLQQWVRDMEANNVVKVIIQTKEDLEWAVECSKRVSRKCRLYLQPEWSVYEQIIGDIVEWAKQNPVWNISIQTHKFMHIP
jgi:maltose-binding protein MalE